MDARLKVTEIFHSIQGESSWIGVPCVFVRLTGCPLRCRWCDTEYAFSGGQWMSIDEILRTVLAYGCPLVEVTGGEPLAQPECPQLLTALADASLTVLLETSGAYPIEELDSRVHRIMDLKCPGSNEEPRNRLENLRHLTSRDEVKFVIADRRDYEWARSMTRSLESDARVLFSPVHGEMEPKQLAEWVLQDRLPVRFQLQLHKFVWSPETRGV